MYVDHAQAKHRAAADVQNAKKFALQGFATDLLEVADNLERATTTTTTTSSASAAAGGTLHVQFTELLFMGNSFCLDVPCIVGRHAVTGRPI